MNPAMEVKSTRTSIPRSLLAACVAIGGYLVALPAERVRGADKPTVAKAETHVFRPGTAEPTDERVAQLKLPPGFRIAKWAERLGKPRMITVGEDGTVYVSRRQPGDVLALRDKDRDGKAEDVRTVANLPNAHGLAVRDGKFYVVTVKQLYVAPISADGSLGEPKQILGDLPDAGSHPNRTIAFGPDGMLYLSIGSPGNDPHLDREDYATLVRMKPDGSERKVFASGLRNTIGFGWHPKTGQLWGFDHDIDNLGDDQPPEELNRIEEGATYGFPYVWGDNQINPVRDPTEKNLGTWQDWQKKSKPPVLMYTAHAAPIEMEFYKGGQFPPEYAGDAFVAMHGSWNRKTPSGYEVVRVRFDERGEPTKIEPFITGFLVENNTKMIGRPCGLAVLKDGSLLVGDDSAGVIYRVTYEGGK